MENVKYLNFPLREINEINDLLGKNPDIFGLNVTIPYKEEVISFLDEIDPEAKKVKAVNTIAVNHSQNKRYLKGYNTDVTGFIQTFSSALAEKCRYALILGTGGASKAVAYGLKKMNIKYQFVSRTSNPDSITYNDLNKDVMIKNKLIINTTPLGMYPYIDALPDIPYNYLSEKHILYDLIYNPSITRFLKEGKDRGTGIINGLQMLINQAEESWKIWNR